MVQEAQGLEKAVRGWLCGWAGYRKGTHGRGPPPMRRVKSLDKLQRSSILGRLLSPSNTGLAVASEVVRLCVE
jgi:hypothetical protein